MRTLLLMRHAKSSWSDPSLSDHERPLAARGRRAARQMAEHLRSKGIRADLALCSTARRARETLGELLPALGEGMVVRIEARLYGSDADELLNQLRGLDSLVATTLLVGHNPGVQDLAVLLAGDGEGDDLRQMCAKFPTGALAALDLDVATWADLAPGCGHLTRFITPKSI